MTEELAGETGYAQPMSETGSRVLPIVATAATCLLVGVTTGHLIGREEAVHEAAAPTHWDAAVNIEHDEKVVYCAERRDGDGSFCGPRETCEYMIGSGSYGPCVRTGTVFCAAELYPSGLDATCYPTMTECAREMRYALGSGTLIGKCIERESIDLEWDFSSFRATWIDEGHVENVYFCTWDEKRRTRKEIAAVCGVNAGDISECDAVRAKFGKKRMTPCKTVHSVACVSKMTLDGTWCFPTVEDCEVARGVLAKTGEHGSLLGCRVIP